MEKNFSLFHKNLTPYVTQISNERFYSAIFSWAYDGESTNLDKGQVARWISGKIELPSRILDQAMNDVDEAAAQYSMALQRLLNDQDNISNAASQDAFDMAQQTMQRFLLSYPCLPDLGAQSKKYDSITIALVTALIYDGLERNNEWIEPGLLNLIEDRRNHCASENIAFRTIHVLGVLLSEPYELLGTMLDHIEQGLAEKWKQYTLQYDKNTEHHRYKEINLNDIELLQCAGILSHSKKHEKPRHSHLAGEQDLCRAIMRCKQSATIERFKQDCHIISMDKWDTLAANCVRDLHETTIDDFQVLQSSNQVLLVHNRR